MRPLLTFVSLFALRSFAAVANAGTHEEIAQKLLHELAPKLSRSNLISFEAPTRWSSFKAPVPAIVVNVETESDVANTVKLCAKKGIPFLAQNGGNGWATNFNLGKTGVLINLARLNQITFNSDRTQVTIGGGANISTTIAHAYAEKSLIMTGNCNCVGTLGAMLGGGLGNLIGLYGFAVDNIISLRVVTADGRVRLVTASSDPDLFWGLRGAAPNIGIVTSAVVKSHPVAEHGLLAWAGGLIFSPDKLEAIVQAIQELKLKSDMSIFMYFVSGGPPTNEPIILVTPFLYKGNPTTGRKAFASIYAIGPIADTTKVLPWNEWNTAANGFCVPGARKPSYSAGFQRMVPSTWRQIWNEYVEFQKQPGAENSAVVMEAYSYTKARSFDPDSASFPHKHVNFQGIVIPWYNDTVLDGHAQSFGQVARRSWRATDGLAIPSTYVNFGHGDEALETIYGSSLRRLRSIKKRYDPKNHFNQWFNIE
ncbi:FAD-linked oxidoreductase OXR1 [Paramyrothecium foliicola]|nr:FAD-linked oxidoreductase OXR1 [Paramyrothecium foliicola]